MLGNSIEHCWDTQQEMCEVLHLHGYVIYKVNLRQE